MFSIELKSKENIKNLNLTHGSNGGVLIEGFLGKLTSLNFTEGILLEINGSNGCLRMDLTKKELKTILPKKTIFHASSHSAINPTKKEEKK
jgi:hypothetical protein